MEFIAFVVALRRFINAVWLSRAHIHNNSTCVFNAICIRLLILQVALGITYLYYKKRASLN